MVFDTGDIFLPVHRIIPFSNVEGMGNRTSIFLQGCNLNCLYCHNPEMIPMPQKNTKMTSVKNLIEKIKGSLPFIRGITVSGGEPTLYSKELTVLFKEVKKLDLSCYLDTNGFFNIDEKKELIEVTDKFLYDLKGMGSLMKYLCFDTQNITGTAKSDYDMSEENTYKNINNLANLEKLLKMDKIEEIRLVYIKGFYDEYEITDNLADLLKDYPKALYKIIRLHLKGSRNPKSLAKYLPKKEQVASLEEYARQKGILNLVTIQV